MLNPSRREFLVTTASAVGVATRASTLLRAEAPPPAKALVAITLDLEMSRNFPKWEDTRWDYEKGNLDAETKRYTLEACQRIKAAGGVAHLFVVGRALEQANVGWLEEIARAGHKVGNHTYDHVNVLATTGADIQHRFRRAPWLIEGREPRDVIRENVALTSAAIKTRIGVEPAGFRTPGGFPDGLRDRPDVRRMLRELGFSWVSSKYPAHPNTDPGREPTTDVYDGIVAAQSDAQPFAYDRDGLIEIPMSPVSDIGAFRNGRWKLEWFLKAVRLGVDWAIEHRAVYDFLGHPSCLYVTDPEFRTIDLICQLVRQHADHAALADLDQLAARATSG